MTERKVYETLNFLCMEYYMILRYYLSCLSYAIRGFCGTESLK